MGARGEHGDVFLFSNLGALWFSENLIRYSLHFCLREVKNNLFSFKLSYLRHFSYRFSKFQHTHLWAHDPWSAHTGSTSNEKCTPGWSYTTDFLSYTFAWTSRKLIHSLFVCNSIKYLVFVVCLEARISVLDQANNPINNDKSRNHERVHHLRNEVKNLKKRKRGKFGGIMNGIS